MQGLRCVPPASLAAHWENVPLPGLFILPQTHFPKYPPKSHPVRSKNKEPMPGGDHVVTQRQQGQVLPSSLDWLGAIRETQHNISVSSKIFFSPLSIIRDVEEEDGVVVLVQVEVHAGPEVGHGDVGDSVDSLIVQVVPSPVMDPHNSHVFLGQRSSSDFLLVS